MKIPERMMYETNGNKISNLFLPLLYVKLLQAEIPEV